MIGGNITDISQYDGVRLITKYWLSIDSSNKKSLYEEYNVKILSSSLIFVGDVHGDFNQFLAPLVLSGLISITDSVKEYKYKASIVYLPSYKINKSSNIKIIYLGDITNEWIFSRPIAVMLFDLLQQIPHNIKYIYGNHDLAIIGRYNLYEQKKLNFALDIPALWNTLKKELNHVKNLKIYKTIAELDGELSKGYDYIHAYLAPLFDSLYSIFIQNLGSISYVVEISKKPYMISHTTWTIQALQQLINNNYSINSVNSDRPSDNNPEQLKPLISSIPSTELTEYIETIKHSINSAHNQINYQKLSNAVNKLFITKPQLYICKNLLTYTRITKNIFLNHIIGHSSGAEFRDQDVNPNPSTYYHERQSKLSPTFFNGRTVYYFDFGCSAGYDHDELSRPDFVFTNSDGLFVSNLPAFSFVISNGSDALLVLKDKTPRSGNKINIQ